MSIRWRNSKPIVEIYDPDTKAKRHVKASDYGLTPPKDGASQRTWQRFAEQLERKALSARDDQAAVGNDEDCSTFAKRWPDDFKRGKGGRERSHSTIEHRRERVRRFAHEFAGRPLRSVTRGEARAYIAARPSELAALRVMFSDALEEGLVDANPFVKLGFEESRGREGIIVLTQTEVAAISDIARGHFGGELGQDAAAMVIWGAYTLMRPGETFAARYSRLDADIYEVREQFHSKLGGEAPPKHGSVGLVYVPEPAVLAVLDKPRRIDDDIMFRTRRGHQWRQPNWSIHWDAIRRVFTNTLPETHHLRERIAVDPADQLDFYELRHFGASYMLNDLEIEPWVIAEQMRHSDGGRLVLELYGHPDRRKALDRIRRAYQGAQLVDITEGTGRAVQRAGRGKNGGQAS